MTARRLRSTITVTDQFCGAGGSSIGAVAAGAELRLAMNHWKVAIETHNSNFPDAAHACADISTTDPRRFPSTDILITSPECTNHSRAKKRPKGDANRPTLFSVSDEEERSRATMWDVPRFAEYHDYRIIIVENVVEAHQWALFPSWVHAMTALGYEGRPVFMNSMVAPPTPQSRDRMYYVWWKAGNRAPDLDFTALAWCPEHGQVDAYQSWKQRTAIWPAEQWGKYRTQYVYRCPTCDAVVEPITAGAVEAIDWSIRGQKIGERAEALKPATLARIQRGIDTFWSEPAFYVKNYGGVGEAKYRAFPITDPFGAVTTSDSHAIIVPTGGNTFERDGYTRCRPVGWPMNSVTTELCQALVVPTDHSDDPHGKKARPAGEPFATQTGRLESGVTFPPGFIAELRGGGSNERSVLEPLCTVEAGGNHHLLVEPSFVVKNYGTDPAGHGCMVKHPDEPFGAVTSQDHHGVVQMPFTVNYNGNGTPEQVDRPLRTVSCRDRYGLVQGGGKPAIEECTFRMLEPHEIKAAMAFPAEYRITGNKRQVVRQLGNAVTPPVSDRIVRRCIESLA